MTPPPRRRLGHRLCGTTKRCLRGETRTPSPPPGPVLRARLASKHTPEEDQRTRAMAHRHILRNTCCLLAAPLPLSPFPARNPFFLGREHCSECPCHSGKKGKIQSIGTEPATGDKRHCRGIRSTLPRTCSYREGIPTAHTALCRSHPCSHPHLIAASQVTASPRITSGQRLQRS